MGRCAVGYALCLVGFLTLNRSNLRGLWCSSLAVLLLPDAGICASRVFLSHVRLLLGRRSLPGEVLCSSCPARALDGICGR